MTEPGSPPTSRLEVWNPGRLPATLSLEQLTRPRASIPRNPLLAEPGLIERTAPEKPTSRLQRYRLTEKGRAWLAVRKQRNGQ